MVIYPYAHERRMDTGALATFFTMLRSMDERMRKKGLSQARIADEERM